MVNIFSLVNGVSKRLVVASALIVAVAVPSVVLAWGPDRPTFTTQNPASYVTFNSITNNPKHGDERNFVQVKPADAPSSAYAETVNLQAGKEYTVSIYFHNNAASNLNESGVGIAKDAYVKAAVPAVVNGSERVVGYVGASNAQPKEVWDHATFNSNSAMAIRMVPGSANIYSEGAVNGQQLPDSIITTGAPLGYDALNGKLPGCDKFSGYVTFKVKADQPNFTVNKQVSKHGENKWTENYTAKPGETVDYRIEYTNTGTTHQSNVAVKDTLPKGMSYVKGSTQLKNANNPEYKAVSDNLFDAKGLNIGNYTGGVKANAFIKFSAKVEGSDKLACGANTLRNVARVETDNGSKEDSADVTVNKTCQTTTTTEQPKPTGTTPALLPSTGPAAIFSGLFGSSALGLGIHSWIQSRRALRDALKS